MALPSDLALPMNEIIHVIVPSALAAAYYSTNWLASILASYSESIGVFTRGVKFLSNPVEPLQRYYHTQTQQSRYGKPKFREILSRDDTAKSHMERGTIVVI